VEGSSRLTDDQGEGFFDASKTPFFDSVCVGEGVAEGVLVYDGGGSSTDSQGKCVGSDEAEESPAKNHLFPTVSTVVDVETEVVVAVNVEKTVVVTGSGVTKLASFRTAASSRASPNSNLRVDTWKRMNINGMTQDANLRKVGTPFQLARGFGGGSMRRGGCWPSGDILTAAFG